VELSKQVRAILDQAGLRDAKIMASGDLDEYKIREIVAAGAPVDAFGVGTEIATSADAPSMGTVYKLVELDISGIKRFTAKFSEQKETLPGTKQIFRLSSHDVRGRSGECFTGSEALLRPVILGGNLLEPLPNAKSSKSRAAESLAKLPASLRSLETHGVVHDRLIVDPGMGFFLSTRPEPSLAMVGEIGALKRRFGCPVMISVSRKSFLRNAFARPECLIEVRTREAELMAVGQGVDYIRTHDVAAWDQAVATIAAIAAAAGRDDVPHWSEPL